MSCFVVDVHVYLIVEPAKDQIIFITPWHICMCVLSSGGSRFSASLCQSSGEENASIIWTPDSGGTMQFLSWLWSTGITILSKILKGEREFTQLTYVHVFCGSLTEFFKTSCCPERVLREYKVFGFLLRFFWSLNSCCQSSVISQTCSQWALDSVRAALCHWFS